MSSRFIEDFQVPKWQKGQDGLRNYIDCLESVKNLGYFETEARLIYSSLCASGKSEIYSQLSSAEKNSITKFAAFLYTNFGLSYNEKKRRFNSLQQAENESENEWFLRCIKEYFATKGLVRPTDSSFSAENKADITLSFLSGLRNQSLKRHLKLQLDDFDDESKHFFHLGKIARRKALSLKELGSGVFNIGETASASGTYDQEKNYIDQQESLIAQIKQIKTSLSYLEEN